VLAEAFSMPLVGDRSGIRVVSVDDAAVEAGVGGDAPKVILDEVSGWVRGSILNREHTRSRSPAGGSRRRRWGWRGSHSRVGDAEPAERRFLLILAA
jgi:hypothetical protein